MRWAFAKYDPVGLAASCAVVVGLGLFLATALPLLRSDAALVSNLSILGSYLLGYRLSWGGALLGLIEGLFIGGAFGFALGRLINFFVRYEEAAFLRRLSGDESLELIERSRR